MATLQSVAGHSGIFIDGDWILSENMDVNGKYGVIQLKHVGVGQFLGEKDFNFINENTFNTLGCTEVYPGDILISRMAEPIGRACIAPQLPFPCVTAVDVTILRLDKNIADSNYIMYLCNSQPMRQKIDRAVRGTTRARITRTELGQLEIPLPPLAEQQRIASLLTRADRLRRLRRHARELSDSLLQSVFLEMFGNVRTNSKKWEREETQEIFEIKLGKMLSAKEQTGKHLRPYLRNLNVQWGYIDFSDINQMDFDEVEFEKYKIKDGDILVCEGGEVGRTAIYHGEIADCCYQNALHRLRKKKPLIEPLYFIHFMKAAADVGLIMEKTSQVTIAHFTAEKFKEFQILIPPLALQEQFAGVVTRHESLRRRQAESARQAEGLFQSMLSEAFRG